MVNNHNSQVKKNCGRYIPNNFIKNVKIEKKQYKLYLVALRLLLNTLSMFAGIVSIW